MTARTRSTPFKGTKQRLDNNLKLTVPGFQLKIIRYANKQEILTQNQERSV